MSRDGKKREVRRSQQADSNLSSAFEGFSRSLDNHSVTLNKFINEFDKTVSQMTRDVESAIGRNSNSSSHDRGAEEALTDISQSLSRSGKVTKDGLTVLQKTGKSIETVLMNVGALIVSEIKTAYNTVSNSYQSHLSSITAQMRMSNKEYTQMYNEYSKRFIEEGLNKQFSPVDYAEALENAISSGLRGDEAKDAAYQNLITNKILPSLNTTSRGFVRLNKILGTDVSENILSIAKYAEASFEQGLDEGSINNIIETLYKEILMVSDTEAEASSKLEDIIAGYTATVDKYGYDAAEELLSLYKDAMTTPILAGSSPVTQALEEYNVGTSSQFMKFIDEHGFDKFVDEMRSWSYESTNGGDLTTAGILQQEGLGVSTELIKSFIVGDKFGSSDKSITEVVEEEMRGYNPEETYSRIEEAFKDGWTQTADAALTKQEENLLTPIASATSSIARFDEALSTATNTLKSLASIWLFTETGKSAKSLLGSLGSSGSSGLGKDLMSLDGASWAQVLTKSGVATPAGVLVGGGSLIAGGAMAIYDGISTGIENQNVGAGLLSTITGDSNIGLTEEEKLSKAEETVQNGWVGRNTGIDWKKVGSNTLKGTAIGAGVGTAAGGWALGAGTAIGAGVGAVLGATASIIDQAAESANFNKLAKSSSELADSYEKLKEFQSGYQKVLQDEEDLQESLNILAEGSTASEEEKLYHFNKLKEQFPVELANATIEQGLQESHIELLRSQISLEKELEALKASEAGLEAQKEFDEQVSSFDKLFGEKNIGKSGYDFLKKVQETAKDKGLLSGNLGNVSDLVETYAKEARMSEEEFANVLNQAVNGEVIVNKDGEWFTAGSTKLTWGDNIEQALSSYDSSGILKGEDVTAYQKAMKEQIDSVYRNILESYNSLLTVMDFKDENGNLTMSEQLLSSKRSEYDAFPEMVETYNRLLSQSGLYNSDSLDKVMLTSSSPQIKSIKEIAELLGKDAPSFKVGLSTVPYDDYLANLHKGEMVLTAENAEKMRDISSHGSGLTGLLSTIEGLSRARLVTNESSDSLSSNKAVVEAIGAQTESIVGVLNSIYDLIARSVSSTKPKSVIPRSTVTFEGI